MGSVEVLGRHVKPDVTPAADLSLTTVESISEKEERQVGIKSEAFKVRLGVGSDFETS